MSIEREPKRGDKFRHGSSACYTLTRLGPKLVSMRARWHYNMKYGASYTRQWLNKYIDNGTLRYVEDQHSSTSRFHIVPGPLGERSYSVFEEGRLNDYGEPYCVVPSVTHYQASMCHECLNAGREPWDWLGGG